MAIMGVILGFCLHAAADADVPLLRFGVIDPPVVAQHDITVRAATSNHPQDPRPLPLECSGMAWLGDRLIITSDRHDHIVFTAAVDPQRAAVQIPREQPIIRNEKWLMQDIEAITVRPVGGEGGWRAYLMSSLSNDPDGQPAPNRRHFARMSVSRDGAADPASVVVLSAESLRAAIMARLERLRVQPYVAFTVNRNINTLRGINVEGIAWNPQGTRLLCGLRNPLADDDAILFAVEGVDEAFDRGDANLLQLTDLFRLNLGGRGVADLAWDPVTRGYLIAAARSNGPKLTEDQPYPLTDLDSALFWWSGHKADDPILFARVHDLNVEAICRVGDTDLIAIGSDEGDVSEGRIARQSVVMLVHFTGLGGPGYRAAAGASRYGGVR
jgi:hypothetical protein